MRRRTVIGTIGGALAGGLAGCSGSPTADTSDETPTPDWERWRSAWPQVAHDARNTRYASSARGPREAATVAWSALGGRPVYPPVVGDSLYLTEAWTGGTALSLASEDGATRWTNRDLPPMRWGPALHGDRLFVLTREQGNVVRMHALDTATGERDWVREEGVTASAGRPPIGPTVRDGSIYLASSRGIVACAAEMGEVEWTATLGPHVVETEDGPTWRTDWAVPAVTDDCAFTFDTNESYRPTREVFAVDRETGDREWTAELAVGDGWYLSGHVVACEDRLFVSANKPTISVEAGDSIRPGSGRLFALDPTSGEIIWDWKRPDATLGIPAYADGTVYVPASAPETGTGRLHALAADDGSGTWAYPTSGALRTPTIASDTVYLTHGGTLAAIAISDGTRRWRLDIGETLGSPIVVGDTAYVVTRPGRDYESALLAVREP